MKQYGLDGVLVQRFLSDIPGSRAQGDGVLKNIIAAAEKTGRIFAIEYDISGARPDTMASILQRDWNYLVNALHVTAISRRTSPPRPSIASSTCRSSSPVSPGTT